MFLTAYRRLAFTAVLTLLGLGAASAATLPWSRLPLRVAPNAWARSASTSRGHDSIRGTSASAQATETFLHTFTSIPDGAGPGGGLVADEDGSLYGTTVGGGLVFPAGNKYGGGSVFRLTPSRSGGYTESILYRFGASGAQDAEDPSASNPPARDGVGALYGTTFGARGAATVYKLTPTTTGYHETILYNFGADQGANGDFPRANPIVDRSGALYGTASSGGPGNSLGVVYKLTPTKSGYIYSLLHVFQACCTDGFAPYGGLTLDPRSGDLYGTTTGYGNFLGSNPATGAVFKLHPTASGYVYSIIHIFQGPNGGSPSANLILDESGALYGTAENGGASYGSSSCNEYIAGGCGAVFKLTPTSKGYAETLLYSFTGGLDGGNPQSALAADRGGNLYSTTVTGGLYGNGTVFELVRTTKGYREVTLHAATTNDDGNPSSGVLLDGDYLIGENSGGQGPYQYGSVYALKH